MRRMGILIAALALAACATEGGDQAAANAGSDCFRSAEVRGFSVIDSNHISLRVGASRRYILTTMWNANDLDWTEQIAIRSATGRICTGNGLGVDLIGGRPQRTFPITSIERAPEDPPAQGK